MTLLMLCVDGLDPDLAEKYGFSMPYERRLEIPFELYRYGVPYTMHIWPSIFKGEIVRHPNFSDETVGMRLKIRRWLVDHGIRWRREGMKIKALGGEAMTPVFKVIHPCLDESLLDDYTSFDFDVPGVSEGFILGASREFREARFRTFMLLASAVRFANVEVSALYIHLIDYLAHLHVDVKWHYWRVFELANLMSDVCDVMLLSDHGCDPVKGAHTDIAYLGCNKPLDAKSVLDVRADVDRILKNQNE